MLYKTSDGQSFDNWKQARRHQRSLERRYEIELEQRRRAEEADTTHLAARLEKRITELRTA